MLDDMKAEIREEFRKEFQKEMEKDWEKEKRKNPRCDEKSWWAERRMGMKIVLGILMGIGGIGLVFLFGWIVMLLWNALMPEIFGLTTLSYWQAWGLLILSTILFKGMGSGHGGGSKDRRRKRELKRYMEDEPHSENLSDSSADHSSSVES